MSPAAVLRLTADLVGTIAAYVRAGAYPWVAAEAAGVPSALFDAWLVKGQRRCGSGRLYRQLWAAVRTAAAEARIAAEVAMHRDRPDLWLTRGPGKEGQGRPGWSGVVKPLIQVNEQRVVNLLADPGSSAVLTVLLNALAAFPEARKAAVAALNTAGEPARSAPRRVTARVETTASSPEEGGQGASRPRPGRDGA